MKLEFDPRDPNECAAVLALIFSVHGESIIGETVNFAPAALNADDIMAYGNNVIAAAAAAEEAAQSAEQAFAAPQPPVVVPAADPTPAAPAVPAGPAASAGSVELDADGLPWDARIHSGPADKRPKTADGKWRKARGVEKTSAEYIAVVAELRQIMGAPAPSAPPAPLAAPPVPPSDAAPAPMVAPPAPPPMPPAAATGHGAAAVTPAAEPALPAPPVPAAPPAPPVAPVVAAPQAPADGAPLDFAGLMKRITALQTAGRLTVVETGEIAVSLGLTAVRDLIKRPDLVPTFASLLPGDA